MAESAVSVLDDAKIFFAISIPTADGVCDIVVGAKSKKELTEALKIRQLQNRNRRPLNAEEARQLEAFGCSATTAQIMIVAEGCRAKFSADSAARFRTLSFD